MTDELIKSLDNDRLFKFVDLNPRSTIKVIELRLESLKNHTKIYGHSAFTIAARFKLQGLMRWHEAILLDLEAEKKIELRKLHEKQFLDYVNKSKIDKLNNKTKNLPLNKQQKKQNYLTSSSVAHLSLCLSK
jgi:hypothetical protein